jgi:hypothetical protein
MIAAKAAPELIPETDIATAIASSKLFQVAANERTRVSVVFWPSSQRGRVRFSD